MILFACGCAVLNHFYLLVRYRSMEKLLIKKYGSSRNFVEIRPRWLSSVRLRERLTWGPLPLDPTHAIQPVDLQLDSISRGSPKSSAVLASLREPAGTDFFPAVSEFPQKTVKSDIDLNAVRANICQNPRDYRFCGYAAAFGGSATARCGLQTLSPGSDWKRALRSYRMAIFGKGSLPRYSGQPYIDQEKARKVLEGGGKLSVAELLRCRVRYFRDGAVLGSNEFVQEQFETFRNYLSERRKSGPRRMRGGDWGGLAVLRDLQKDVIS